MTYLVRLTPRSVRQLGKLDRVTRLRIEKFLKVTLDRENPRAQGRALVSEPFWRYRVGDYRILASIDDDVVTILVVAVEHRRDIYRR